MSKNNGYNSILFLTTLSVYFGLVLVGASPSVLAQQAALSQKFEIQKEIESEDELDNDPDDELKSLASSIESYFDQLEDFVEDLSKLHSISKFDLGYDKFSVQTKMYSQCSLEGHGRGKTESIEIVDNIWLKPSITEATYRFRDWNSFAECLPTNIFKSGSAKGSELKLKYDGSHLIIEFSSDKSSSQHAAQLAENFNKAQKLYEIDEGTSLIIKSLFQNTVFKAENQQFLIVTTLPRGSLDALVKGEKQAN